MFDLFVCFSSSCEHHQYYTVGTLALHKVSFFGNWMEAMIFSLLHWFIIDHMFTTVCDQYFVVQNLQIEREIKGTTCRMAEKDI